VCVITREIQKERETEEKNVSNSYTYTHAHTLTYTQAALPELDNATTARQYKDKFDLIPKDKARFIRCVCVCVCAVCVYVCVCVYV